MDYNQIEKILLSFGLSKHTNSEGDHFTFSKGNKHRTVFERLRLLKNGGAGGYLYAVVLDEYKNKCSKHGHICVSKIKNETEFENIVERVIKHFDTNY